MKRNIAVVLAFLVLAAGLFAVAKLGIGRQTAQHGESGYAVISVHGKEYKRVPLGTPCTVEIQQEDGDENVVEITENGVRMAYSNCHNQLCVDTGEVTRDNIEYLPNQGYIVCLPHRVSVEVIFAED